MSRPTAKDVHVDAILTNISIKHKNAMYIAEQIFPIVSVTQQSDKYYIFTKADMFRNTAKKRAPGTASEGQSFGLSTDTYFCEEVAQHTLLEDEVRDNADSVLALETTKTQFVTDKIYLELEARIEAMIMTTTNWDNYTTLTGTNQWSDYDNSDPITDFETGIDAIEGTTGKKANTIVLAYDVWKKLKHHPQLLDRLPVTGLRQATTQQLATLLEVEKVLIGRAKKNTAAEGQTASYSGVWTKDAWIGHVAGAPAKETATAGYIFVWKREGKIRGIRRWREENIHSEKIEAFMNYDEKIVGSDLGYTIASAIA